MADLQFFRTRYGAADLPQAFEVFLSQLDNYLDAAYYVDWPKVRRNIAGIKHELALLNVVAAEPDPVEAARNLLRKYPQVVKAFPVLMATRKTLRLVESMDPPVVATYDFNPQASLSEEQVERYVRFLSASGLLDLLKSLHWVPDYATGVEVGLDTNGRKNRGGMAGAKAVGPFVAALSTQQRGVVTTAEANAEWLEAHGIGVPAALAGVTWDFAICASGAPGAAMVLEVNHYASTGSKPSAIAREYEGRDAAAAGSGLCFVWVTDGLGWLKMHNPLRHAFERVEHIANIQMLRDGYLPWLMQHVLRA